MKQLDRDSLYKTDIIDSINYIEKYIDGVTEVDFLNDQEKQDSVIRRLEIIGEAANRLSKDFTTKHPEIPWHAIVGLRNKLIHEYAGIDPVRIWDVIKESLSPLKEVLLNDVKTQLKESV